MASPHKITFECMKSQIPFPFPPRNVPCDLSDSVSEGGKVVVAHGKGGIVPNHGMYAAAKCLNSAPAHLCCVCILMLCGTRAEV